MLGGLGNFVNSTVEKFSKTNSVRCQLSVIFGTSNIAEGQIKERLGNKLGDLEITNVEVVGKFTTSTPTGKPPTTKAKGGNVFQVKMKISNEDYTDELSNSSSEKFRTLSSELTDILNKVFQNLPGFSHVVIIGFRKGSVICIFQVIVTKESEVTAEVIQETLSDASKKDTGNYTFEDITVKEMTMKQTGQRLKWPDWAIIVTCLCAVMLLFIIVTIFLVRYLANSVVSYVC